MNQSIERLTSTELKVLELVADHYTNGEIANLLVCSPQTVKSHVHRILKKLEVRTRGEPAHLPRGVHPQRVIPEVDRVG